MSISNMLEAIVLPDGNVFSGLTRGSGKEGRNNGRRSGRSFQGRVGGVS